MKSFYIHLDRCDHCYEQPHNSQSDTCDIYDRYGDLLDGVTCTDDGHSSMCANPNERIFTHPNEGSSFNYPRFDVCYARGKLISNVLKNVFW